MVAAVAAESHQRVQAHRLKVRRPDEDNSKEAYSTGLANAAPAFDIREVQQGKRCGRAMGVPRFKSKRKGTPVLPFHQRCDPRRRRRPAHGAARLGTIRVHEPTVKANLPATCRDMRRLPLCPLPERQRRTQPRRPPGSSNNWYRRGRRPGHRPAGVEASWSRPEDPHHPGPAARPGRGGQVA